MPETNRRRHPRSPVLGYPASPADRGGMRLLDIGSEGLGFEVGRPFSVGTSCWIRVGENATPVLLAGEIRWCRRRETSHVESGFPFRVGVQIRRQARRQLDRAIFQRQPLQVLDAGSLGAAVLGH